MGKLLRRVLRWEPGITLGQWLYDRIANNAGAIIAYVGGGGLMYYLGSITAWAHDFGPLGWALIAIAAIFAVSGSWALMEGARSRRVISRYSALKASAQGTNVLAAVHQDERLDLSDFYYPFLKPTLNARFANCDLMGPALVAIFGCTLNGGGMQDCDIVIARSDRPIKGATVFRSCTFVDCHMYLVTWIMPYEMYQSLPADIRASVPVISDGRIGDV
jgi:hypothetical protein